MTLTQLAFVTVIACALPLAHYLQQNGGLPARRAALLAAIPSGVLALSGTVALLAHPAYPSSGPPEYIALLYVLPAALTTLFIQNHYGQPTAAAVAATETEAEHTAQARVPGPGAVRWAVVLGAVAVAGAASLWFTGVRPVLQGAQQRVESSRLRTVHQAATLFQRQHARCPTSVDELVEEGMLSPRLARDVWGAKYRVACAATRPEGEPKRSDDHLEPR